MLARRADCDAFGMVSPVLLDIKGDLGAGRPEIKAVVINNIFGVRSCNPAYFQACLMCYCKT